MLDLNKIWREGCSNTSGVFVTSPAGSGREMLGLVGQGDWSILYVDCALGDPDDLLLSAIDDHLSAARLDQATDLRAGLVSLSEHLDAPLAVVFDNVDLVEKWQPAALKSARDHLNSSVGAGLRLFFFGEDRAKLGAMVWRKIEPFYCAPMLGRQRPSAESWDSFFDSTEKADSDFLVDRDQPVIKIDI
jgi:hypothetical protein